MNLFVSVARMAVPVLVGLVLAVATRLGLQLDDAAVTQYVTAGLVLAYYLLWRGLEVLAERLAWQPLQAFAGVLLGWARPPEYRDPVTVPIRVKVDRGALEEETREALAALERATAASRRREG
ncbi:hypothetical protein ACIQCF_33045 [Streptomyces sp. NPDC088353]|uniref:hypothetical protein n=1 Tax=Streptomyces sp. NPDC088353 TaxID=3365855 RepID=UPI003829E402